MTGKTIWNAKLIEVGHVAQITKLVHLQLARIVPIPIQHICKFIGIPIDIVIAIVLYIPIHIFYTHIHPIFYTHIHQI